MSIYIKKTFKMKKYSIQIIAIILLFGISACDKIERPKEQVKTNEINSDTVTFPAIGVPIQKFILEEFTGQTCINCPLAHKEAAKLKTKYGDTIVLMAIHAGIFSAPEPSTIYTADFRTEAGNDLNDAFGVQSYPNGLMNRTPYSGNMLVGRSQWSSAANALDRTSPKLGLQILTSANSSENSYAIYVKTTFLESIDKNIKLAIFIIEDSIVSPQKNSSSSMGSVPDITDYIHRHMLRDAVNSVWGVSVASSGSPSAINSSVIKGYTYSLTGKPFVPSRCSIIALAYDVDTKAVLQVEETHLVD